MKKVTRPGQMRARTKGQNIRRTGIDAGAIKKKDLVLKDPLAGKSGGTGLDDYNLDVMILE